MDGAGYIVVAEWGNHRLQVFLGEAHFGAPGAQASSKHLPASLRPLLEARSRPEQARVLQDARVRAALDDVRGINNGVERTEREALGLRERIREIEEQLAARRAELADCERRLAAERERQPAAEAQFASAVAAVCDEIEHEERERARREREQKAQELARLRAAAAEIERELGAPAGGGGAGGAEGSRSCSIAWELLTLGRRIGRGSFKEVYQGEMQGTPVAALLMPGGTGLQAEVALMARLGNSPNIAVCYGMAQEPAAAAGGQGRDCLVMEFAPHGALADCLERLDEAALPAQAMLSICTQVAQGMSAVAAAGIIHRDLATRNVLVFSLDPILVKVTDFGLSRLSVKGQSVLGTQAGVLPVRWAPPEAISGRRKWVLEVSDVWAFGVLMWEVYTRGFVPYDMIQHDNDVAAYVCGGGRLDKPQECPDALYQVRRPASLRSCCDNAVFAAPRA